MVSSFVDLDTHKSMVSICPKVKITYDNRINRLNAEYCNFENLPESFNQEIFVDFVYSEIPSALKSKKNLQTYAGVKSFLTLGYLIKEFSEDFDDETTIKFYRSMFSYNYRFSQTTEISDEVLTFIDINITKLIRLMQSYDTDFFILLQRKFQNLFDKYHNAIMTDIANINF